MQLFLFHFIEILLEEKYTTIDTYNGRIKGGTRFSHNGNCYGAFEAIPYAEPPNDNRRFLRPEPKQSWAENEIFDASKETIIYCVQPDGSRYHPDTGSEDCLYLWVYTPATCKIRDEGIFISL